MTCCKLRVDGVMESLPFERKIATRYYDGAIEGFTECSECKQTYAFHMLDWDDAHDQRIIAYAPLDITMKSPRALILPELILHVCRSFHR